MKRIYSFMILLLLVSLSLYAQDIGPAGVRKTKGTATMLVAASNAPSDIKRIADYRCSGTDDHVQINQAIQALPASGGIVHLSVGDFDINSVSGASNYYGIFIDDSNTILEGSGWGTRLILNDDADDDTGVVRVSGDGIGHITIRDLYINGNSSNQTDTANFDTCGIKVLKTSTAEMHNVTVENCFIEDCTDLCVMMNGKYMKVMNNTFGDADHDVVEVLVGPAMAHGNYFYIDGASSYILGSDAADDVVFSNNVVYLASTAEVKWVYGFWKDNARNILADNYIYTETGATIHWNIGANLRGINNVVTGNFFYGIEGDELDIIVCQGASLVANNYIFRGDIIVYDNTAGTTNSTTVENNTLTGAGSTISIADNPIKNCVLFCKAEDGAANTAVTDDSGAANGGTSANNTDTMQTTGYVGDYCFDFCSVDGDYVTHDAIFPSQPDAMTLAFWMNHSEYAALNGLDYIVAFNSANNDSGFGTTNDETYIFWDDDQSSCGSVAMGGYPGWHFWTCTIDTLNDEYNMYVDAALVSTVSLDRTCTLTTDIRWGGSTVGGYAGFDGKIDNLMIFDRILNEAEILYLWNQGLGISAFQTPANWGSVRAYDMHIAHFQDVLDESATAIVNAQDCSDFSSKYDCTIAAQPDCPRNVTLTVTDANTGISAFTIRVRGLDARGAQAVEEFLFAGGLTQTGYTAFSFIDEVTIENMVGNAGADTVSIGTGTHFGLGNEIFATSDVFKVKENNADYSGSTILPPYNTVNFETGAGVDAGDDFTVFYRSNKNRVP